MSKPIKGWPTDQWYFTNFMLRQINMELGEYVARQCLKYHTTIVVESRYRTYPRGWNERPILRALLKCIDGSTYRVYWHTERGWRRNT